MRCSCRQASACGLTLLCCLALGADRARAQAAADPDPKPQAPPATASSGAAEEPKPDDSRYEEEITVTGHGEPSLTRPGPQAAARELATVPGGTTLIDAEEYKRGRASTLDDALAFAPGVFVQPRFGSEEARLSIRGSGLQRTFHGRGLKLLQDGVPLNLADGSFDFQAVEPLAARYVEVYRGPNALRYGSTTLGGAINFVSMSGRDGVPAQARLESGAFGYLRGQASAGSGGERLDTFATLAHSSQDGFRDHAEQSSQRLFANLGWRPRAERESRAYFAAVRTRSELPGNLTLAQLAADPRQAAPGNVALDQQRNFDLLRLSDRTSFLLGPAWRLDLSGFYSYKHLDHPIFQVLDQLSHDVGAEVRFESAADLGERTHSFIVGLSPSFGTLTDDRFVNVAGERGAPTAHGETTSENLDLYAEVRLEISSHLQMVAGFQASRAVRDFDDRFLRNGDQTDRQTFSGLSPKLGLLWGSTSSTSAFVNVSRSFEPPTFGELTNVGGDGLLRLDAQTATSAEVGTRGRQGRFGWDVVLYHARLDDELLSLEDAAGNPLGTINAGRTVHSGAEVGFDVCLPSGLLLRQVYNWSRFRFADDPAFGDNVLAGIPEHQLRTELLYQGKSGFYGGPMLEWVPDGYPVDHANTLFAQGYAIAGLTVGYRRDQGLAGFIEVKNLTDETYTATTGVVADAAGRDSAQFLPGDGVSAYAGLEYRW